MFEGSKQSRPWHYAAAPGILPRILGRVQLAPSCTVQECMTVAALVSELRSTCPSAFCIVLAPRCQGLILALAHPQPDITSINAWTTFSSMRTMRRDEPRL